MMMSTPIPTTIPTLLKEREGKNVRSIIDTINITGKVTRNVAAVENVSTRVSFTNLALDAENVILQTL